MTHDDPSVPQGGKSPGLGGWGLPTTGLMKVEKCGIVFSEKLSLHARELLRDRLMSLSGSASRWIGDWPVYGETSFRDRYREAIEKTSFNYQTLRNYAWVARQFDVSRPSIVMKLERLPKIRLAKPFLHPK
jgi:hypothetical protein